MLDYAWDQIQPRSSTGLLLEDEASLRCRARKTTSMLGAMAVADIGEMVSKNPHLLDPQKCQEYVESMSRLLSSMMGR